MEVHVKSTGAPTAAALSIIGEIIVAAIARMEGDEPGDEHESDSQDEQQPVPGA